MLKYDIENSAPLTVHLYLRCYVFNWLDFPLTHFWFIFSSRSPLSPVLSALIYLEQRGSTQCSVVTLSCPKSYILPPPSPLQNHNNNISSTSGLTRSDCEEELSKLSISVRRYIMINDWWEWRWHYQYCGSKPPAELSQSVLHHQSYRTHTSYHYNPHTQTLIYSTVYNSY